MLLEKERQLIVEYGKLASASGLCPGTSGNMSIYDPETGYMAISPSGVDYFSTTPEDVVVTDLDAHIIEGTRKPSSEWGLHTIFYKNRPEARAVVHTHSMYCTTFAILGQPLKAVHYVIASAGTDEIPCAPYCTFGTPELAEATIKACGESQAVLLANHGMVCYAGSLPSAYSLAKNLEYVAELQYRAQCIGTPNVLPKEEIDTVKVKFQSYGQPKKDPGDKVGY